MSWLTIAKYGVPALVLTGLTIGTIDRFDQAAKVAALKHAATACDRAAASPAEPVQNCSTEVAAKILSARRGAVCEQAIAERDIYAIRAACPEGVKKIHADLIAAQSDRADLREQLTKAGAATDKAVARAETRATATATRKAANARTIETAPRTADGSVRCDADCLRRLGGEGAPGAAARP